MAILFASNNVIHWDPNPVSSTLAGYHDSANVPYSMILPDDDTIPQPINMVDFHNAPSGDSVWYSFEIRPSIIPSSFDDGYFINILDINDVVIARVDMANGKLASIVYGDTTVSGSATTALTLGIINNLKLKMIVNGSGITLETWLNGAIISTATALNINALGVSRRLNFQMFDVATEPFYISEFLVSDTDPSTVKITRLDPVTAGTDTDLTGSAVGDLSDDNDFSGYKSGTTGDKSSFNMDTYSGADTITAVAAVSKIIAGDSGPVTFKHYLLIGGIRYFSSAHTAVNNEINIFTDSWALDPSDSTAWTAAKINAAQLGSEITT